MCNDGAAYSFDSCYRCGEDCHKIHNPAVQLTLKIRYMLPIITDARADHSRLTDDLVPYAPHFDAACSSLAWYLSLLFDVNY